MFEQKQNNSIENNKIQIFTLGQFKIQFENGFICNVSSRSNKLWNLFKFLLINRNKGIPPEIILEYLYPDEAYEDPQNSIHNMIYRLRKLLANAELTDKSGISIVYSNGCYKLNIQDNVWLDFDVFEKYIKNAEVINSDNISNAIEYYKSALAIYAGELFPELVYEDWIIPRRTFLSKLFIQSTLKLSELYSRQYSYDLVVQVFRQALLIDPYDEEIHMRLVKSLLKIGKYREAKMHYEETAKAFEKQYGIAPTKEMQEIQQLLKTEFVNVKNRSSNVNLSLIDDEEDKGAFFCEYREFYAIYTLEKRRSERSGCSICPVSIEFNNKNTFKTNSFKNTVIDQFKKSLLNSLRRGDTFTLVNKTQFLILLPNLEYSQVKLVMDRVINKFKSIDVYKDINIEAEVCISLVQKAR
jgi:two-component SAPR family response regulator